MADFSLLSVGAGSIPRGMVQREVFSSAERSPDDRYLDCLKVSVLASASSSTSTTGYYQIRK
jgi:hypothetical protein